MIGFILGYLFKKISKIIVVVVAVLLIGLVLLGQNEIINIGWLALRENSDLLVEQAGYYQGSIGLLFRNGPFSIGIIIGAILGLIKG